MHCQTNSYPGWSDGGEIWSSRTRKATGKELLPYTTLPIRKEHFDNFGHPKIYTKGWDYQSRSTALGITKDPQEMMEFESSTRGGIRRSGSKPLLPPIKKVLVSPVSTQAQEGLSEDDRFKLWVYNNKNEVLDAMSAFDLTKHGFMSAPRVLAVLDQEIKSRDAPISLKAAENVLFTAFVDTVELNGRTYEDVINYSQWLHTQWQAGMRIYNEISKISPVKTVFNEAMPASLMSDGAVFANNKEARAAKKLVDAVRVTRRAKRDEMEYQAAKELLVEIKFKKIKNPKNRDKVKQTLSAYSVGKGMNRAIREQKPSKSEAVWAEPEEDDAGCSVQ